MRCVTIFTHNFNIIFTIRAGTGMLVYATKNAETFFCPFFFALTVVQ